VHDDFAPLRKGEGEGRKGWHMTQNVGDFFSDSRLYSYIRYTHQLCASALRLL
jgi:hypothetical protein